MDKEITQAEEIKPEIKVEQVKPEIKVEESKQETEVDENKGKKLEIATEEPILLTDETAPDTPRKPAAEKYA